MFNVEIPWTTKFLLYYEEKPLNGMQLNEEKSFKRKGNTFLIMKSLWAFYPWFLILALLVFTFLFQKLLLLITFKFEQSFPFNLTVRSEVMLDFLLVCYFYEMKFIDFSITLLSLLLSKYFPFSSATTLHTNIHLYQKWLLYNILVKSIKTTTQRRAINLIFQRFIVRFFEALNFVIFNHKFHEKS